MGFMESAIVIYLRELYYPNGFDFPLTIIPPGIAIVEILREAATLIMLVTIGLIAGKNAFQRLALFLFAFAIWDLFYYIFLKAFIDWPSSLFTWDILFLIPVPWTGPVLAPCILAVTMLIPTFLMAYAEKLNVNIRINRSELLFFIGGTVIVITSFVMDYLNLSTHTSSVISAAGGQKLFNDFMNYVPTFFNWKIFIAGEILLILGMSKIYFRIIAFHKPNIDSIN